MIFSRLIRTLAGRAALVCTAIAALGGQGRLAAFAGASGLAIGAIATPGYVAGTPLHNNASIVPLALLAALAQHHRQVIALPLRCEGRTPGLLTVYAAEKNSHAPHEAALPQFTADLRARNETLTRFNHVAVGRELRRVELKREVNNLCSHLGEPSRHRIVGPEPVVRPPATPHA